MAVKKRPPCHGPRRRPAPAPPGPPGPAAAPHSDASSGPVSPPDFTALARTRLPPPHRNGIDVRRTLFAEALPPAYWTSAQAAAVSALCAPCPHGTAPEHDDAGPRLCMGCHDIYSWGLGPDGTAEDVESDSEEDEVEGYAWASFREQLARGSIACYRSGSSASSATLVCDDPGWPEGDTGRIGGS
ncbi:hypothetical protein DFJ74DRAFT_660210 [Hyaloraphidium curvatum]|nr:hypothetical protein DFJ74DRAFT_660210 [Hyaloraphidium curvatum]